MPYCSFITEKMSDNYIHKNCQRPRNCHIITYSLIKAIIADSLIIVPMVKKSQCGDFMLFNNSL